MLVFAADAAMIVALVHCCHVSQSSRNPVSVLVDLQVTAICLNHFILIRHPSFPAFERFCFYSSTRRGVARRHTTLCHFTIVARLSRRRASSCATSAIWPG